ncbi:MAG: sigma-70 family RNA polymerase sigma factor [Oscillospiraceae bacterium]
MIKLDGEKDIFVKENLGLVHLCANKMRGRGIEYDDLYGAGCMGLLKAINGFDESRGVAFSTYAVPVILGEIKRLFRDGGALKVSRSLKELSMRAVREREKYIAVNFKEPTISILANLLGESVELTVEALGASLPPMSLTDNGDDDQTTQMDIPVPDTQDSIADIISLKEVIKHLDPQDRTLIFLRYFKNKTQTQTAKQLGLSQVQVSRREKKILTILKNMLCE